METSDFLFHDEFEHTVQCVLRHSASCTRLGIISLRLFQSGSFLCFLSLLHLLERRNTICCE